MTVNEIKQVGVENGLPSDYRLSGTKRQIANQVLNFFKRMVDYECIRYYPDTPDSLKKVRAERDVVEKALITEL